MTKPVYTELASELWHARLSGNIVSSQQHPSSVAAAYEILAAVTDATNRQIVGYKLGATADATLELLQLNEPFGGALLDGCCLSSGAQSKVHSAQNPAIETEFVLGLAHDLPATGSLTETDVASAVAWVAGGFEIISARFAHMPTGRGVCTIADGAGNHLVVTGDQHRDWQKFDLTALPAAMSINGNVVASGTSGDSLQGSPLGMLTWFANSKVLPPRGLLAGDIVYCGTCTGATPIKPGDHIEADFGALGKVSTEIVS